MRHRTACGSVTERVSVQGPDPIELLSLVSGDGHVRMVKRLLGLKGFSYGR